VVVDVGLATGLNEVVEDNPLLGYQNTCDAPAVVRLTEFPKQRETLSPEAICMELPLETVTVTESMIKQPAELNIVTV
jgi:hypothetical protein